MAESKKKLVLHTCCAICGAALVEELKSNFEIIVFFYNPNIQPEQEYEKRLDSAKKLAEIYKLEFIEGDYEPEKWLENVRGLENEPENGIRCPVCFKMRLEKTAQLAEKMNADFTTTLLISPYKNKEIICCLGGLAAETTESQFFSFENLGLNKQKLWQKTKGLAKKYDFYHQKYCGCQFSQY